MRLRLLIAIPLLAVTASARAEWLVGYEGDDTRGYGFLSRLERMPLSRDRQLVLWGTASYLFYDIREASGTTRVSSPGVGGGVVYKWLYPRLELGLGPGYEVRWTRRKVPAGAETDETEQGPFVQGDLHYRFSSLTRLTLLASFSDANEWLFTHGHLLREVSDSFRAGPEASVQGNDDVRVRSYGAIAEVPFQERTALQFHAGQSRVRYRGGNEETRPYFSVGLVRSF